VSQHKGVLILLFNQCLGEGGVSNGLLAGILLGREGEVAVVSASFFSRLQEGALASLWKQLLGELVVPKMWMFTRNRVKGEDCLGPG
jgi:hypothetical protein